jgi:hypothetical protein
MKNILYFFFALCMVTVSFSSCGDDVVCELAAANTAISESTADINAAITAFNQENSEENCDNIEDAYNDHIDLLRDFDACPDLDMMLLDDAIQTAIDELNALNC